MLQWRIQREQGSFVEGKAGMKKVFVFVVDVLYWISAIPFIVSLLSGWAFRALGAIFERLADQYEDLMGYIFNQRTY